MIAEIVPRDMLREPVMAFLQHHLTRHLQMKVRFSRWDDILAAPAPAEDLPHARATWEYGRGRALVARGNVKEAEAALEQVRATARKPKVAPVRLEFNTSGAILGIASEVLAGHVSAANDHFPAAVAHFREAARLEDVAHLRRAAGVVGARPLELGMMLLRARRAADGEQAFRDDLKRFPDNGWSLRGLELALREQGRTAEADNVKAQSDKSWSSADVEPPAAPAQSSPVAARDR